MSKMLVKMDTDDWVWMCDFVLHVIKYEDELKPYEREDLAHLYNVLKSAEAAEVV